MRVGGGLRLHTRAATLRQYHPVGRQPEVTSDRGVRANAELRRPDLLRRARYAVAGDHRQGDLEATAPPRR